MNLNRLKDIFTNQLKFQIMVPFSISLGPRINSAICTYYCIFNLYIILKI